MRLENFLALTQTELVNEPCVSSFENIAFDARKVKRGDLFFAYRADDVSIAVANGAYGIVFDTPLEISDQEIAWIKTASLENALQKLLRFKMIEKEIVAYECNEITLKLSMQIVTDANFFVLSADIKSMFHLLWNLEEKAIILFCPALTDRNIFATLKKIPSGPFEPIEIVEQTLFETSFIYKNVFYERRMISPFFITYLEELLHFYKTLNINYKLKRFTPIEHFEAVFTNTKFEIKNFGTSDKVLIFEPNVELIESQILFLQRHASWANIIFIAPLEASTQEAENIFTYKKEEEILNILKSNRFHFALIVGVDKSILNRPLAKQVQLTMDF